MLCDSNWVALVWFACASGFARPGLIPKAVQFVGSRLVLDEAHLPSVCFPGASATSVRFGETSLLVSLWTFASRVFPSVLLEDQRFLSILTSLCRTCVLNHFLTSSCKMRAAGDQRGNECRRENESTLGKRNAEDSVSWDGL